MEGRLRGFAVTEGRCVGVWILGLSNAEILYGMTVRLLQYICEIFP